MSCLYCCWCRRVFLLALSFAGEAPLPSPRHCLTCCAYAGAVGQAFYRLLSKILTVAPAGLSAIGSVSYWAPEITEERSEEKKRGDSGTLPFYFHPAPPVTRESLNAIVDGFNLKPGDIVCELATRIDTPTIWAAVKAKKAHFANTGFDSWPDTELDLEGLDALKKHADFTTPRNDGTGSQTCVFSFGCNPGIASHFVRHGLAQATGEADAGKAAELFDLKSIVFEERDTQWSVLGTKEEEHLKSTLTSVLYNTWSPGNYLVETEESTLLYPGIPAPALELNSAGPTVLGWIPSGPIIGMMPPHDETFTIQPWFGGKTIPALFVYEASPTARGYIKSGKAEPSDKATCKLLTPKTYNLASTGYDMLGALMFSNKPGVAPFYCGIEMNVADAAAIDPTGSAGPTAMQVTGGLWTAVQFILQHPKVGDCFAEDVPTDFVVNTAFPWSGRITARSAPEALNVSSLFDPGAPSALANILAGEVKASKTEVKPSPIHAEGVFAAHSLIEAEAVAQLPVEGSVADVVNGSKFNHSFDANAYVDRNRTVRTAAPVAAGSELTLNYALLYTSADKSVKFEANGIPVTNWTSVPAATLHKYLQAYPIDETIIADIRAYFAAPITA
jgi:homospermidine synthase